MTRAIKPDKVRKAIGFIPGRPGEENAENGHGEYYRKASIGRRIGGACLTLERGTLLTLQEFRVPDMRTDGDPSDPGVINAYGRITVTERRGGNEVGTDLWFGRHATTDGPSLEDYAGHLDAAVLALTRFLNDPADFVRSDITQLEAFNVGIQAAKTDGR